MTTATLNLARILWHTSAALLVIVAVIIAGVRLLLLDINSHNDWFEQWLARTLDRPVSIGELSGEWRGWSPSLRLDSLTVYEANKTTSLVHFKYAHLDISIAESIRDFDLKPKNITLGGVEFTLERDADGNFAIAGMPPARWPVAKWVEGQRRLTLTDATIRVAEFDKEKPPQTFEALSLSIVGDGQNRQISGSAKRQAEYLETWQFSINANDSILASDWDGDIYLQGKDIDPLGLTKSLGFDLPLTDNPAIDFTINTKWRDAKLRKAVFETVLQANAPENTVGLKLHGAAQRLKSGWSIGIVPQQLADQGFSADSAPIIRGRWLDREAEFAWAISDLAIKDLRYVLDALMPADSIFHTYVARFKPVGVIRNALVLAPQTELLKPLSGKIHIEALAISDSGNIPALSNLDLSLGFGANYGKLLFEQPQDIQIQSSKWLEDTVAVNDLQGAISWTRDDLGVTTFSTADLNAVIETFSIRTIGKITFGGSTRALQQKEISAGEAKENVLLDFVSYIGDGDLKQFKKLVPKNLLPAKGERWARTALQTGEVTGGAVAIRGPIEKFPFDDNDGLFSAVVDVQNLDLKYGAKWPMVEKITGQLLVDNRQVNFNLADGQIYSSSLSNSQVEIPNLFTKQRNVRITGKTMVSAEEVNRFIDESPLRNTNAKQFNNVDIDSRFGLELDIDLGIYRGGEKTLLGQAHFDGNRIKSRNLKLALDKLEGSVSFTRQDWYGEGLSASFEGNRVGVLFNGGLDDPNYDTEIRLTGTSSAEFLLKQMTTYTPQVAEVFKQGTDLSRLTGSTSWQTVISLPTNGDEKNAAPRKINLQSNLKGLSIDLPWPLGKTQGQTLPFSMTVHSSDTSSRRNDINLSDRVAAKIVESAPQQGKRSLIGANLVFSNDASTNTELDGINLRGQIAEFNPSDWQPVLQQLSAGQTTVAASLPINVDLTLQNLTVFGNQFPKTRVSGTHSEEGWHLRVDGEQISGEIGAPDNTELPVHLKFSRLNLSKGLPATSTGTADPRSLRPVSLESLSTNYGEIDLGRVSVSSERIENGLRLSHATAEASTFTLHGSGEWTKIDGINQSHLNGFVKGNSLAGLLGSFGYEIANIEGGATALELNAFWPGTPANFALEKLRGHLTLDVEAGRFLDIEPGGGRLFGLLSLQTLPRRLSLDFDDLFSKGFTFDNIDGTFSIERGNAYTNSLLMDGPAARIQISGRTGLKEQDYDQRVTVTPALSNSIPVASALFGPAGIGVGAVIYLGQKMFKSIPEQMDKFLSREYSITGDWSSPVIEKI